MNIKRNQNIVEPVEYYILILNRSFRGNQLQDSEDFGNEISQNRWEK